MTLQERIADAKAALHDLMTGRRVRVVVDQNGERVEYSAANRADLSAYIAMLEAELSTRTKAVGAMRLWF
ncbi:phage tail protein [Agrobacterium tumefaciens]|uniref:Phage tail protein n=1 Tax=Agrobacterium tumefaciens TaxID=358 RepID=A0AAJ4T8U6_AGRTU|nr:phage tail protein [Agrobacterium tumefaciens]